MGLSMEHEARANPIEIARPNRAIDVHFMVSSQPKMESPLRILDKFLA